VINQTLGVVETLGISAAFIVADAMAKAGNVQVAGFENTDGGRVSVLIRGDIGNVRAAIRAVVSDMGQMVIGHCLLPCSEDVQSQTLPDREVRWQSQDTSDWLYD
jgi:carbon dioxide concentrating mechanism protein CcmK